MAHSPLSLAPPNDFYRDIVEHMSDGVIVFDRKARLIYANAAAALQFDRPVEQLIGRVFWDVYPAAAGTPFFRAFALAAKGEGTRTALNYYPPWDKWYETRHTLSDDVVIVSFSEVTDRMRADMERRHLLLSEQAAREAAEAAIAERDSFAAETYHDLGNLLHPVLLYLDLLIMPSPPNERRRRGRKELEIIRRCVRHMKHLMSGLVDDAAIGAHRFSITRGEFVVAELVRESLEWLAPMGDKRSITIGLEITDPKPISCDRDRVQQVIANLVGNAIKFARDGGRIMVRVGEGERGVLVSVSDNGIGMSADVLPHIFDRYWQTDDGKHRGSGLGLFIAKQIVEAHGGRIWVESVPNEGSTFFFTLPR
jgi:signal transduction histidine kinase